MHVVEPAQDIDPGVLEPVVDCDELVTPPEEHVGLVVVDDLLQLRPDLASLDRVGDRQALIDEGIDGGVAVAGEVELVLLLRRVGVPHRRRVDEQRGGPARQGGLEVAGAEVGEEGVGLEGLDVHPDTDVLEVGLDEHRGGRTALVAGVRREGELEDLAVLVEPAVVVGVGPARCRQDRLGLGEVVGERRDAVVVDRAELGRDRADRAAGVDLAVLAGEQLLDHAVDVDRHGEGLADALVGEQRVGEVPAHVVGGAPAPADDLDRGVLLPEHVGVFDEDGVHHVDAAVRQLDQARAVLGDDPEDHAVEVRPPGVRAGVVRVRLQHDALVGLVLRQPKRAEGGAGLADGVAAERAGVGVCEQVCRHGREAGVSRLGVAVVRLGEVELEVGGVDDEGTLALHHLVQVPDARAGDGRVGHHVVGEGEVVGGDRLAVLPGQIVAQREREHLAIGRPAPLGGQSGLLLQRAVEPAVDRGHRDGAEDRGVGLGLVHDRVEVPEVGHRRDHEHVAGGEGGCWPRLRRRCGTAAAGDEGADEAG